MVALRPEIDFPQGEFNLDPAPSPRALHLRRGSGDRAGRTQDLGWIALPVPGGALGEGL